MAHYCRICGRTRANEKFSGKGHKKHVCKECSGKGKTITKKNGNNFLIKPELDDFDIDSFLKYAELYQDDDDVMSDDINEELPF